MMKIKIRQQSFIVLFDDKIYIQNNGYDGLTIGYQS